MAVVGGDVWRKKKVSESRETKKGRSDEEKERWPL